jgi:hypothetical protein
MGWLGRIFGTVFLSSFRNTLEQVFYWSQFFLSLGKFHLFLPVFIFIFYFFFIFKNVFSNSKKVSLLTNTNSNRFWIEDFFEFAQIFKFEIDFEYWTDFEFEQIFGFELFSNLNRFQMWTNFQNLKKIKMNKLNLNDLSDMKILNMKISIWWILLN